MSSATPNSLRIFIDADACPLAIKEIVFRTAQRRGIKVLVVANQSIATPDSEWITRILVPSGADMADHAIVQMVAEGDIVIADDVPLAGRVVAKGATVIASRGERLDEKNIQSRLATRDLMEQLRSANIDTPGPKPFSQKDAQTFANQLDRTLTKALSKSLKQGNH